MPIRRASTWTVVPARPWRPRPAAAAPHPRPLQPGALLGGGQQPGDARGDEPTTHKDDQHRDRQVRPGGHECPGHGHGHTQDQQHPGWHQAHQTPTGRRRVDHDADRVTHHGTQPPPTAPPYRPAAVQRRRWTSPDPSTGLSPRLGCSEPVEADDGAGHQHEREPPARVPVPAHLQPPEAAQPRQRVGSGRGAVSPSRAVRFPGPHLRTGRASSPASGSPQARAVGLLGHPVAAHGVGICAPR